MTKPRDLKSLYYTPLLPLVWILEGIVWLFRPRILKVDREFAEHLVKYGGAKLIYGKKN